MLPGIHLLDEASGTLYSIESGVQARPDVTVSFNDGTDYDFCGVLGKVSLEQLSENISQYCILLSVNHMEQ